MDPITEDYFRITLEGADRASTIRRMLHSKLPRIKAEVEEAKLDDVCLIADVGGFIIHALEILGHFATEVVYGEDIILYTRGRLEQLEEQTDLSDLAVADCLDDKLSALK